MLGARAHKRRKTKEDKKKRCENNKLLIFCPVNICQFGFLWLRAVVPLQSIRFQIEALHGKKLVNFYETIELRMWCYLSRSMNRECWRQANCVVGCRLGGLDQIGVWKLNWSTQLADVNVSVGKCVVFQKRKTKQYSSPFGEWCVVWTTKTKETSQHALRWMWTTHKVQNLLWR